MLHTLMRSVSVLPTRRAARTGSPGDDLRFCAVKVRFLRQRLVDPTQRTSSRTLRVDRSSAAESTWWAASCTAPSVCGAGRIARAPTQQPHLRIDIHR